MTEGESTYNLIERYLNGEMDPAEKESFRLNMAPEMQEKLKAHVLSNQLIKENRLLNVKALAQKSHIGSSKLSYNIKAGIISGVIIIAAAYFWGTSKNETIIAQEISKPDNQVITKENKAIKKETITAVVTSSALKPFPKTEKKQASELSQNQAISEVSSVQTTPIQIENLKTEKTEVSVSSSEEVKTMKVPCENVKIQAKVFSIPACINESNGSINVSGYSGGTPPYGASLTQDHHSGLALTDLKQGFYNLLITDANNCQSVIHNIKVNSRACQKNYHFNPFTGEKWEIPTSKLKGTLIIKDNAGNSYFTTEIYAEAQEYWTGQSQSGEMKPGYYLYIIQYSDGNTVQGSVTVVQ